MIGPGRWVGVLLGKLLSISLGKGRLARHRSEENGCPFLDLQEDTRKAAIFLALGSARGDHAAWTSRNLFPEASGIVGAGQSD